MTNDKNITNQMNHLLQQNADALAVKHQQRLHQMTREAIYGKKKVSWLNTFWLTRVAAPVLTITAVALIVNVSINPKIDNTNTIAINENVPAWVEDTQVPINMLENIAFYEWLEKDLKGDKHA